MKQMNCIENIKVDISGCLKPCSGLIVTSFTKTQEKRNMDNWLTVLDDYQVYKKVTVVPFGETGKYYIKLIICFPYYSLFIYRIFMGKQTEIG